VIKGIIGCGIPGSPGKLDIPVFERSFAYVSGGDSFVAVVARFVRIVAVKDGFKQIRSSS
jgi:hypothetical protein